MLPSQQPSPLLLKNAKGLLKNNEDIRNNGVYLWSEDGGSMYVNDSYFEQVSCSYVLRCIKGQDDTLVMTVHVNQIFVKTSVQCRNRNDLLIFIFLD